MDDQINIDEDLARQIESDIEWESTVNENCVPEALPDVLPYNEVLIIDDGNIQIKADDVEHPITDSTLDTDKNCIHELSKRVETTSQFFIVTRKGSTLSRCLNLWQRESKRTKADKTLLRVHFTGEDGRDSGAMAKDFLAKLITQMAKLIFSAGSPVDSTHTANSSSKLTTEKLQPLSSKSKLGLFFVRLLCIYVTTVVLFCKFNVTYIYVNHLN